MQQSPLRPAHLLTRTTQTRCQCCPPERVCAWDCVQGMNVADIVTGAVLEQSRYWSLVSCDPGQAAIDRALMESFNG